MGVKDINVWTVTGRLTADAALKYTSGGFAICNFSIAYNRSIKQGDKWEDKSCYMECVIFGKRGEVLSQYLAKGKGVTIQAEIDHQTWEDKETGKKRSKHVAIVDGIKLESGGKKSESANYVNNAAEDDETDIPF